MSGSLYEHALALHRQFPDGPLPNEGAPYPDEARYRARDYCRQDLRTAGADVATVLDQPFATGESARQLALALADLQVPIHLNDHITAAALVPTRLVSG